jgi:predicted AlkP superfamily pyrophosphatase or phosphodiesterase
MKRLPVYLLLCIPALIAAPPVIVVISIDGFPNYALRDAKTAVPALRRLIREGAVAADGMLPINPTVTWPNHTAMVTGVDASKHGVLYNGLPVRAPGKPVRIQASVPKSELVQVPTVYDLAHQAGLKTAEVDWVAIEDTPSIDYSFFEIPKAASFIPKEMIANGAVTLDDVQRFTKTQITWRDEIWTEAVIHILREHRPNLMLFHLLTTDTMQHTYGARSLGAQTALSLADRQVQRILDTLKDTGMLEQATVFIVSDHGFATAKRQIQANVVLHDAGLIRGSDDCDVWTIPEGGTAMVYITNQQKRTELAARLPGLFRGVEGIQQIIEPKEFREHGYPPPGPSSRMSDLVLAAADGYSFGGKLEGPTVIDIPAGAASGNHGYLRTNPDMRAIFVAWGASVRPGIKVQQVRSWDVAPTVGRLLGIEMKNISGHTLTEVLK